MGVFTLLPSLLVVFLAITVFASACGDDDDDSTSAQSATDDSSSDNSAASADDGSERSEIVHRHRGRPDLRLGLRLVLKHRL